MPVEITSDLFDPQKIMDSGQCFRMVPLEDTNSIETIASGRRAVITPLGENRYGFDCSKEEFDGFWRSYFALDVDYQAILASAPADDAFLTKALEKGRGLRILRQDPWETLCGFIISQRKSIKAIRTCMEALCDAFGDPIPGTTRKTFPSPQQLAAAAEKPLCACGLGYRLSYIRSAAQMVASGTYNLAALAALPDEPLQNALKGIHGVGVKVADCVMLFAYGRYARAPVDVWIQRVIDEYYDGHNPFPGYGAYAGIFQQYLFVLRRDEGKHKVKSPQCSKKTTTKPDSAQGE